MEAGEECFGVSPVPSSAGEAPSQLLLAVRAQLPGLRHSVPRSPAHQPPNPPTLGTDTGCWQWVPLGLEAKEVAGTSSG